MRAALLALTLLALPVAASAQPQAQTPAQEGGEIGSNLPSALAEDQITVRSDYSGSYITVFGVNPDRRVRGDIVVVVRGPSEDAVVMRKRRVFGFWMNDDPVRFTNAPAFFAVLSNRPLRDIASPQLIWRYRLDPAASARLASGVPAGGDPSAYRAALVRLRRAQGLYREYSGQPAPEERGGLTIYDRGLFRAVVRLPANAPIARYHADSYVFYQGRLISSQRIPIPVERVGVERQIHDLATQTSFFYGVLTVLLALGAGWLAAFLFRRS